MDPKTKKVLGWILIIIGVFGAGFYLFKKNIGTNIPSTTDTAMQEESVGGEAVSYLKAPAGFQISFYAKGVPGARVMAFDDTGDMLVSSTSSGTLFAIPDRDNNGVADKVVKIASGLNKPHGLAFKRLNHDSGGSQCGKGECKLFVAEANQLSVYDYENTDSKPWNLTNKKKLLDIEHNANDQHFTRTLLFLSPPRENILLISVGSSCNVCNESGSMRSKVLAYDINTGKVSDYATGLRNAVFLTENPINQIVYLTEMGRDKLGDNIPPDEINILDPSKVEQTGVPNFGWPICYGKNIHDDQFDKNTYIRNPCMEPFETPSFIDLQAHSAPLGLAFIPEGGWPEEYQNNLLVAYHGSWNRSTPTGYKIVRIKMNAKGEYLGTEDFITGFLTKDGKKLGRPVDVKVSPSGLMYISDDLAGVIYQASPIAK